MDERKQMLRRPAQRDRGVFEQLQAAGLDLDGAVVANPPRVHADPACALFEAGVPIYLEKPMAADLADARRIMASAQKGGTDRNADGAIT